ncbi:hypothetical protein C4D60_Mb00t04890 [Musa balbisiana]|uniref:Uncharacterized protein n=1 Tax=Musa balbisiana TaxID=52838 RepID=A0A4S8I4Z7_MUSBA|nr:hypothetical protein C4D60_Mb00t04890 [Musa balbisiana]
MVKVACSALGAHVVYRSSPVGSKVATPRRKTPNDNLFYCHTQITEYEGKSRPSGSCSPFQQSLLIPGRQIRHSRVIYICSSRNGIAILDSDKTLICLRNALNFIGSLIRQKGRSFLLKTQKNHISYIMEEMASCINDSQCRIGAFFTHSCSSPTKIRSRKNKINFGSNQQPDCVVILDPERKCSVILEADRSQIPIASLVFSMIPLISYKRCTYPIPTNDPIQFIYLFCHSITKIVLS